MQSKIMPSDEKSSAAEVERRISTVIELLLSGWKRRQILQYGSKIGWNVTDRQIDTYIAAAYEEIDKGFESDREKILRKTVSQYELIYRNLMKAKDYRGAASVLDKIAEITGVKVHKVEHSGHLTVKQAKELTDDELAAIIASGGGGASTA